MQKTLEKPKLHSNKQKNKFEPEMNRLKSNLSPHLQSFKQKLLSVNGFSEF